MNHQSLRSPGMVVLATVLLACSAAFGDTTPTEPSAKASVYDPALAQATGADERGMRRYVLVILKSSGTRVPDGPRRDAMFKGHFANMERLAGEGKLAMAGPLDGVDGWRGLFVFAVSEIEEAQALAATDPVIVEGEMVAEYHKLYGSAALMLVNEAHSKLVKPKEPGL